MSRRALFVNALTFSRVPLIFAWLGFALACEFTSDLRWGALACVAMLLSALTDLFDGMLARKWNVVTTLGKMADPLMDKVFYIVAFPSLAWLAADHGEPIAHVLLLLAFTILYLLRDLWVTFMRSVGTMYGADVAAMWLGKVRTALSFPCAGWVYLYIAFHGAQGEPCAWEDWWLLSCYLFESVMISLTLVSLVTYTRAYLPYLKRALERKENL